MEEKKRGLRRFIMIYKNREERGKKNRQRKKLSNQINLNAIVFSINKCVCCLQVILLPIFIVMHEKTEIH
jgi:hypothetical protein